MIKGMFARESYDIAFARGSDVVGKEEVELLLLSLVVGSHVADDASLCTVGSGKRIVGREVDRLVGSLEEDSHRFSVGMLEVSVAKSSDILHVFVVGCGTGARDADGVALVP